MPQPPRGPGIDAFAVERAIRGAAPEILFAPPRTVRRLLRRDRDDAFTVRPPPHREIAVLDAARLAAVAGDVLVVPADIPARVAVVARPDAVRLGRAGPDAVLRGYWRRTFHALLDLAAGAAVRDGRLDVAAVIGAAAFAEARDVLVRESLVDRNAPDELVSAECAATFLERRCFAPESVAEWFPAIADADDAAVRISAAIDAETLLHRALPPGLDPEAESPLRPPHPPARWWPGSAWLRPRAAALRRRADATALTGNVVRAMLDEWRAADTRPPAARPAFGRLERLVDAFARRLAWALGFDAADAAAAARLVRGLIDGARGSAWSQSARVLFDLQKLCVDSERESFRTQLLRWLVRRGQVPLAKPLPCQRLVLIHRHALAAARRLPAAGLPAEEQESGGRLLAAAVAATAAAARETLRPLLADAVRAAGLEPRAVVEEAAADKLVAELLDDVIDRGFIPFGAVRDAVSRNQLKLPDLQGLREWIEGDELLRLDRRLAATLDGVYRPAPIYLAVLQRLSAPFFGTPPGRLLTTHVLLPFGGAWLLLRGLEHVVEPVSEYVTGHPWHLEGYGGVLATGLVIWAMIHVPAVRIGAWHGLRAAAAAMHTLLVVVPQRLLRLPVVERLLRSPPVRWFIRYAWSPLVVTLAVWVLLPRHGRWVSRDLRWIPPAVFAASAAVLNTAAGRRLQEQVVEAAVQAAHRIHVHVIVGLVGWVVDVFRRAMDAVEAGLYAVDESLRFRSDESGVVLAAKAVAGAAWSVVEAGVRFCITLLIEPQLNPIKHFPVVTVSHKLLVPMIPVVASQLVATTGMERGLALTAVTFISTALPGVFGFLAWELKENWRLYAANRPRTLRPVPVGHHGETVRRLLLPGFHSGTVPKLFARLRHGSRRAARARADLEHAVAAFLDRDVIALLDRVPACSELGIAAAEVAFTTRRIEVHLRAAAFPDSGPLVLELARDGQSILSRITAVGWLDRLDPPAWRAVRLALTGYQRFAAADAAPPACARLDTDGRAGPDLAEQLVNAPLAPVPAVEWVAWRNAWEAERGSGADGRSTL
ncbi:MAG: hypothetical protein ACKO4T_07510 [Planctomycetaceae bacterium]